MTAEQTDEKNYQYIKENFDAADGQAVVFLINQKDFQKSKIYICNSMDDVENMINDSRADDIPYAFISNFMGLREFYYSGEFFRRNENLNTGEITINQLQKSEPVDLAKLREEFLILGELLRKGESF